MHWLSRGCPNPDVVASILKLTPYAFRNSGIVVDPVRDVVRSHNEVEEIIRRYLPFQPLVLALKLCEQICSRL